MDCEHYRVCQEQGGYEGTRSFTEAEATALYCPKTFVKGDKAHCVASQCMGWKWVSHRPPQDPPVGFCLNLS